MTAATTRTPRRETPEGIHFGQIELDLIATHVGVPFPVPLRVPSFGRIAGEREVLLAAAGQTLQARGLADEDGPAGAAAELATALREHRGTVYLVLVDGDGATAIVAMVYRSWALICEQPLDNDPASPVRIRRVVANALTDSLLAMVPDVAAARSMPISLPERAISTAPDLISDVADDAAKERLLRELVRDCGGDPDVLDHLAGLLSSLTGRGQLGATRRDGDDSVRAGTELSWLDGPRGRVRVNPARNGWMSINPLRRDDFRFALEDLAGIARRPR
ncbi:ESX secretion-associated protein EspG [Saccharopolyspora spinosa]|uniref:ESAT-6 protein secretion system EspG family protein n=1 Tax=Saccharopolyspora spinosa TaxID=60894 RepID=A0A2N3Y281_SACSN|nr:ESX secretion-associated protein EspG [Saccharopolyspora spinosa]PKW16961.1 ESAT-6 protein secretion system EspG family protein [Saccharopolyspora spinosa]